MENIKCKGLICNSKAESSFLILLSRYFAVRLGQSVAEVSWQVGNHLADVLGMALLIWAIYSYSIFAIYSYSYISHGER